ncbi:hypothetical protein EJB05_49649, partial [Eragrostis curvula]
MEAVAAAGQRRPASTWLLAFYSSLLLNVLLLAHHFLRPFGGVVATGGDSCGLSWALQPAKEAEAGAATECSGHGQVFLDGITGENGRPGCECNRCFGGPDCSVRMANCSANAASGNPLFLEPYWKRNAATGSVMVSAWHRLGYITTDGEYQSVELQRLIRQLHRTVGNAAVDDKHLVFGTGSIQLVNALVHALSSPDAASPPARVVATAPYYASYRTQTRMFDGREYGWGGTTTAWANASSNATHGFIELVASPNNPDTLMQERVLRGSAAIVDRAYYWPHFTHIPAPADDDIMLFTASKLSGNAGSRFGWALIRDENVAERANDYVQESTMGASRDSQLRMLVVIKAILANLHGKEDIFAFGHDVMSTRWRRLNAVVSRSRRISLQKIPPQYCTYFKRTRAPSPAYAWIKCEREEDQDCHEVLLKAKVITRSGVGSEASSRYTRASLLKTDDDFDMLLEMITDLVNDEKYSTTAGSSPMSVNTQRK